MGYELLHMFEHPDCQSLIDGGKIVQELRKGPTMFQVIK